MIKHYKVAVLIGRFQPFHTGHRANVMQALGLADHVQILVGSSFQPRTPKNPFKFHERMEMISSSIDYPGGSLRTFEKDYSIHALRDFKYSDNSWIAQVQKTVASEHPGVDDKDICILGYDKDESSWYNHAFPEWDFIPLEGFVEHGSMPIDATKIRELYFEGHLDFLIGAIPATVFNYLKQFMETEFYRDMVEEYKFYKNYHKSWEPAPFVPIFQTTDACVIQGGHILLIQRGFSPGKGLWALPGGFINPKERLEDCVIRELVEETKIKVPEIVLRKGITYKEVFDHPDRDLRGRTITMAYLIELNGGNGELPRVKGSDDAKKAKWFKLSEVEEMGEFLYGDHAHIIKTLVARAKT
jgi:bifunctional NMN adenylyltransferase/nudix hydrolase